MILSDEQVELIKKIRIRRKTRKSTLIIAFIGILPILAIVWFQLTPQLKEINLMGGVAILIAFWIKILFFTTPTRARIEDLLLDYVNSDPESIRRLTGN